MVRYYPDTTDSDIFRDDEDTEEFEKMIAKAITAEGVRKAAAEAPASIAPRAGKPTIQDLTVVGETTRLIGEPVPPQSKN